MPRLARKLSANDIRAIKPGADKHDTRDGSVPGLMVVTAPSGRKVWMLEYQRNGKRTRMSLEILADAKAYTLRRVAVEQERAHLKALKLRAKMVDKAFDPRRKNGPEPVPTLERYLDDSYGPWVKLNRSDGAATIGRIKACFLGPFGYLPINQITSELVEDWRTSRIEAGILPSTINRDTGALRACLSHRGKRAYKKVKRWCLEHPFGDLDPLDVAKENPRYLRREDGEDTRLFRALDDREGGLRNERANANKWRAARGYEPMPEHDVFADHIKPMVLVLLYTGLRYGELSKLQWGAIDFSNKRVTVTAQTAKSKKTRTVPLNGIAIRALKDWRAQTKGLGVVFSHKDGGRIGSIRKAFGGVLEAAKVEDFTIHHLRHTFASWLVQDGAPIYDVSNLLGHANVATTQIYAHLAPDHSRDAVERLAGGGK